jgi:23S rRNA (uracil1939-C5)-methyltransferase
LQRIGHIQPPEAISVVSGEPWQYRNRSQFHLHNGQIGYLEEGSHRLCPIDHCPISSPKINEGIRVLRSMLSDRRWPRFVRSLELFTDETAVELNVLETGQPVGKHFFEWFRERMPGSVPGPLDYSATGVPFRVSGQSFFQVNRFLIDKLVDTAVGDATGASAIDLYAGVGLFSLSLAKRFGRVIAVEAGMSGEQDLRVNAERAGVHIDAVRQQVESFMIQQEVTPDFVLADPPRSGLGKVVVNELIRLKPPRLTIVACDPSTLARDLVALLANGYAFGSVVLVDLFPQTYHMETVVDLRLM